MSSKKEKDFKKLQKEWYQKLKETGFKDIEAGLENPWQTTYAPGVNGTKRTMAEMDEGYSYYVTCGQFLYEHEFKSEEDKKIWDYHSQGLTYREIAKLVNKKKTAIGHKINYYKAIMLGKADNKTV